MICILSCDFLLDLIYDCLIGLNTDKKNTQCLSFKTVELAWLQHTLNKLMQQTDWYLFGGQPGVVYIAKGFALVVFIANYTIKTTIFMRSSPYFFIIVKITYWHFWNPAKKLLDFTVYLRWQLLILFLLDSYLYLLCFFDFNICGGRHIFSLPLFFFIARCGWIVVDLTFVGKR